VNKITSITAVGCLLVGATCAPSDKTETKPVDDNTLLALILSRRSSATWTAPIPQTVLSHLDFNDPNQVREYIQGLYTVVAPQTTLSDFDPNDTKEIEGTKKNIRDNLKIEGYDIGELVDRLFERNKKPVRLSIDSSPYDGYIVDYEGDYHKYFKRDGGGWEKLYQDHPKATGYTDISLPAYDPKTRIVIVYKATQHNWLDGAGWVIAYKYEAGKLKELGRIMLWIS
jgi:hypothetical protein